MTIDEAIQHCEEVAAGNTEQGKCPECAADHKQLAGWLRELVAIRAQADTTPNAPLTLEQLREMDGDPVWVVEINSYPPHWGLVYWCRKNKRNIVYVTINNGASICAETSMAAGVKIYRHKPEEGTA